MHFKTAFLKGWCAAAIFILGEASPALAQTNATWTGLGTNANWSTQANWTTSTTPLLAPPSNNATIPTMTFGSTTSAGSQLVNQNDLSGLSINTLTFLGNATTVSWTLNGNPIQVNSAINTTGPNNNATINANLVLGGNVSNGNSSTLTTINGIISETGGSRSFSKAQSVGVLTLNGLNTFSGAMLINGGTVNVNTLANVGSASSIGTGVGVAAVRLGNAGNATLLNYTGGTVSTDRQFQIGNGNTGTTIQLQINSGGTVGSVLTFSNPAFNANDTSASAERNLSLGGAQNGVIQGVISNNINGTSNASFAVGLIKTGNGQWFLQNTANTYSGGTTINAGTLLVDANGSLGGGDITFNGGTLANNSAFTLTKAITLNGAGTITGTPDFVIDGNIVGSGNTSRALTLSGAGSKTLNGTISGLGNATGTTNSVAVSIGTGTTANLNNSTYAIRGLTLAGGATLNLAANTAVVIDNDGGGGGISGFDTGFADRVVNGGAGSSLTMSFEDVGTNTGTNLVLNAKISGQFKSNGGQLGTTRFTNDTNDFSRLAIQSSVVESSSIGNAASASRLGTAANIELSTRAGATGSATLRYTGAGETSDKGIFLMNGTLAVTTGGAGAVIENNGTGLLHLTGAVRANGFINFDGTGIGANITGAGAQLLRLSGTGEGELSGIISDGTVGTTVAIAKEGTGAWNLSGVNTYTGGTVVNAGTLAINGSITGALSVAGGATLGGSGTIGGDATIAGIHSPGNSPGIQTITGNLSYLANSVVNLELTGNTVNNAPNPSAIFDQIIVNGNLNFSGLTTLNLDFASASTVDWSDAFWSTDRVGTDGWLLYAVGGTTTDFSNLALNTTNWADGSGALFNTVRAGSAFSLAQQGSDIYLTYVTAIPEPSSVLVITLATFGIAAARRRRKNGDFQVAKNFSVV